MTAHSLDTFQNHLFELLEELAASGEPHLIQVEGGQDFVIQEAEAYRKLVASSSDAARILAALSARERAIGLCTEKFEIPESFFEPLPDELVQGFSNPA